MVDAKDGTSHFGASRADQPSQSDDLTGMHLKRDTGKFTLSPQTVHPKQRPSRLASLPDKERLQRTPDHVRNRRIGSQIRGGVGPDILAVSQDGDLVRDGEDLFQPVTD